jgi:AP-4 complex subunit epsilon-1
MYAVITQVIQKADTGSNIGNAIIYESVQAVTSIYPNNNLMETAAAGVSRFISISKLFKTFKANKSQNLLFLGIQCLKSIVRINAKYAAQHQQAVINCLEHKDESIKRVTLDLLYAMTNPDNCEVIVKKLLKVAQKSVIDSHLKEELIKRISFLAENYAPNAQWYVETMNKLFDIGPEFIPMGYVQNMLNIVAEGSSDGDEDEAIRIYCVESYVHMLETKDNINDKLMLVIAWIIGEYGYLSKKYKPEDLIEILCEADDRKLIEETRIWLLPAVMKLCAQIGEVPLPAQELARKFINSKNVDIQQRAYEYLLLKENVEILDSVFPVNIINQLTFFSKTEQLKKLKLMENCHSWMISFKSN